VRVHTGEVDGVDTAWWDFGPENRPVDLVMVHGFRGDHHGLEPFVAALGPEVRVLIPDLPGFGLTRAFASTANIDAYATWLSAFCAIHAPGAAVLGHSFGSIVVAAARSGGLKVPATILVNPIAANALQGPRGLMTKLAVGYYRVSAKLPERWGYALLRNRAIVRVMSVTMAKTKDKDLRRWIHEQHDEYFSVFDGRRAVLEAFQTSVRNDVGQFARGLTGPVLMIVADRDDITSLAKQRELAARLDDATLHIVKDVGHLVHYEAADEAADAIKRFLKLPGASA
jgi:pimeloyl-ACP methyl ester carboxylesterase